jgi:hypothetical protein
MKKFLFVFFLFLNVSFAATDLGSILNSIASQKKGDNGGACSLDKIFLDIKKEAKEEIQKNMTLLTNDLKKDAFKKMDEIKIDINDTIKKEINRLDGGSIDKAKKLIDKADDEFDKIIAMKNKATYFISNAKFIGYIIGVSVLLIVIMIIFAILKLKKIFSPATFFSKFDERIIKEIKEQNKKISELESKIELLLKK